MRFEVTVQETTQTFVFSEVQLPGTADLYSAIEEAQGYRDETLQLKEEVEAFKEAAENAATVSTSASEIAVEAKDTTIQAKNDTLAAKSAVEQQAAIVATNTQTTTQKAQEASTSAQEALTSRNQAQGIKEDVESIAQEVDQDRLAVEQAKTSIDLSVIAVDADAQQVANDKAIIQQLTLENQALRAENQILTNLSRDYNTQSANNAIGAIQTNIGGTNGIDNILPVAQLMPGMGLNGVNFLVARSGAGATAATNFNLRGMLERAIPNRPRFDFDPVTRRPLGVLVEAEVTNLTNSIGDGLGINSNITKVDLGLANNPTGVSRVYEITQTAAGGLTSFQSAATPIGQFHGISLFLRVETDLRFCYVRVNPGGQNSRGAAIIVNLQSGIVTPISIGGSPTTGLVFSIIRHGAYWFVRLFSSNTNQNVGAILALTLVPCASDGSTSAIHPPVAYSSVFAYTSPDQVFRSHILSVANTTRPADNLTQNISSWSQSEGTIVVHVRPNTKPHQSVFIASDGAPVQLVPNGDDLVNFSRTQGGTGLLPVITPKSGTDRFGNPNTVDRVFFDRGASDTLTDLSRMVVVSQAVPQTGTYRISFWGRSVTGTNQSIRVRRGEGGGADSTLVFTSTWQLFSVDAVFSSLGNIEFSLMTRGTVTPQTCDIFLSEISIRRVSDELRLQADGTLTFTRSGVTQSLNLGGSLNTFSSYAISYSPNRVAGCRNGGTVQEITTAGNINVTNISYAPDVVGASKHVFAQYFARAMSNLSMQGKTGDFKYGQEPGDFALNQNLGELAFHSFQNLLAMGVADQTLRIRGTNALVTEVISRNYPFEVISLFTSLGGTITVQNITGIDSTLGYFPAGSVATLTFNATVGTVWDVAIRPRLTP